MKIRLFSICLIVLICTIEGSLAAATIAYQNNNPINTTVAYMGSYTYSVSWVATGLNQSSYSLGFFKNSSSYIIYSSYPTSGSFQYTIAGISSADDGYYYVGYDMNNGNGLLGNSATVYLHVSPAIITQPQNTTCLAGSSTTMGIAAGPSTATFQWIDSATGNILWTGASFSPTAANNGERVYCKISNNYGSVSSSSAILTVGARPTISGQPASVATLLGGSATFSVAATGTQPLYYQWYEKGVAVVGANLNSFSINPITSANIGSYSVTITNQFGYTNSVSASLTASAITITAQPTNTGAVYGSTATFSVTANGSAPLYYQWYKNGVSIQGANLNYLVLSSVTNTDVGTYQVAITNSYGSANSSIVTLNVGTPILITNQPSSLIVTQGQAASLEVYASGSPPIIFQWKKNGTKITGATNSIFNIANTLSTSGATYTVTVTNLISSVTSSNAILTVLIPVEIISQPIDQTSITGGNAFFSVTANGTQPIIYQWFKGTNSLIDGANLIGTASNTITLNPVSTNDDGLYSVFISNAYGSITSSIASLSIGIPPQILNSLYSSNNTITLQMTGTPGFIYAMQAATNLLSPIDWQPIFTNAADANGNWIFTDSNAPAYPARFYRGMAPVP